MSQPFAGDHWGTGFDEEVQEGWTDSDTDDDGEDILTPSSKVTRARGPRIIHADQVREDVGDAEARMRAAREVLRGLTEGAYWKDGGVEVERMKEGLLGWRQVSTGVSAISLAYSTGASQSWTMQRVTLFR